jgi:hypothetical protein
MRTQQDAEVDQNYDAFQRLLGAWLPEHRGQYALMRSRQLVEFFDFPGDAFRAGTNRFEDGLFSIQEVTDEPIDLGLWSHVEH